MLRLRIVQVEQWCNPRKDRRKDRRSRSIRRLSWGDRREFVVVTIPLQVFIPALYSWRVGGQVLGQFLEMFLAQTPLDRQLRRLGRDVMVGRRRCWLCARRRFGVLSDVVTIVGIMGAGSYFGSCHAGIGSRATSWSSVSMDVSIHVVDSASDISVGTTLFNGSLVSCSIVDYLLIGRKFGSTLS